MGAASGGMFFFVSGAPAGAHHATFLAAAFTDSDATECGVREAAVILRKLKVCLRLPWGVARAEAEIFVKLVGQLSRQTNEFAGIHLPVGIPGGFEFAKGLHQLGADHFR